MNISVDILEKLFIKYPFKPNELSRLVCGIKHCGIELTNGNIGICSTLGMSITNDINILYNPDFSKIDNRIVINAWVNANANYSHLVSGNGDIFDIVDFSKYQNIVMVGFFGSLSAKFQNTGISITIFDIDPTEKPVAPFELQKEYLGNANAVILTATSISNLTFTQLMNNTSNHADVFILGPSTPLDLELLSYPKVKALFGSQLSSFDNNSLDMIEAGMGTKSLLPFIKKVYIYNSEEN